MLSLEEAAMHITADSAQFEFSRGIPPVLEVASGSEVSFTTGAMVIDRLVAGESPESIGLERLNAVSGPVAVTGAAPGDALRIDVLDVAIEAAWSVWMPGFGPLGGHTDRIRAERTPVVDDVVELPGGYRVPAHPMIGCIGVAPAEGSVSTLRPVGRTGGNMDLHELEPGSSLWLPVEVPGALLSVGDLHAAMGHGEPTYVALEAVGTATLRLTVEAGAAPPTPRLRAGGATVVVGLGATAEGSWADAVQQALTVLCDVHGMEPFAAYAYLSAAVDLSTGGPASPMTLARIPDPSPVTP